MALTDPIFRRNLVEFTTNLERSNGVRRSARDRNILLFPGGSEFGRSLIQGGGGQESLWRKSAACRTPIAEFLEDWGNLNLDLLAVTYQIEEGHSIVEILLLI
jgi:hypothetical protein